MGGRHHAAACLPGLAGGHLRQPGHDRLLGGGVAAAGATGAADTAGGAALLVAGVGLGSLAWVSLLATGTAGAGRALGPGRSAPPTASPPPGCSHSGSPRAAFGRRRLTAERPAAIDAAGRHLPASVVLIGRPVLARSVSTASCRAVRSGLRRRYGSERHRLRLRLRNILVEELKPIKNIDDPRYVKAMSHPLRVRILAMLDERTASPNELSGWLGANLGTVAYHVRMLDQAGLIELVSETRVRGAVEHHYRANARPNVTAEGWAQAPPIAKQAAVGASLAVIAEYSRVRGGRRL